MADFNILAILPFVLGGIGLLVAIGLIAVGITNANQTDPLAERLKEYGGTEEVKQNLEQIEMSVPFSQRVLLPIMQQIARLTVQFTPQEALAKTQHQLVLAGSPGGLTPPVLWTLRFGAAIGLAVLLVLVFTLTNQPSTYILLGGVGGALVGYFMPQLWLVSKINRRKEEVIKTLPDALDLMSICVEAGLSFDQAMTKVSEKWEDNELARAFARVIREIQLGKTRREALRNMSENIEVPDVTSFAGAIIQADQLGVSISRVLKIQADQMRVKRRQRAQEKAQQAPVKMMIPMVFFIFPTIWIVLLGPAGVQLYKVFWGGGL
ncbi:MAG: type II secretion system F family protein [Anaerolineae bacterium]